MGAIAGEGPAIVERPKNTHPLPTDIGKQQPEIAIMAVEVMKMDDIRADPIQFCQNSLGGGSRIHAVIPEDSGLQSLELHFLPCHITLSLRGIAVTGGVKGIVFYPFLIQKIGNCQTDFPGTAGTEQGVNLYELHIYLSLLGTWTYHTGRSLYGMCFMELT